MFVYVTIRLDVRPVMNVCLPNNKVRNNEVGR